MTIQTVKPIRFGNYNLKTNANGQRYIAVHRKPHLMYSIGGFFLSYVSAEDKAALIALLTPSEVSANSVTIAHAA